MFKATGILLQGFMMAIFSVVILLITEKFCLKNNKGD